MKTTLLTVLCVALFLTSNAQENQVKPLSKGKVIYEETIKLNIPTENIPADVIAMLPKERKTKSELLFNPEASLYQPVKEEEKPQDPNQGGTMFRMNVMGGGSISYYDIKDNKLVEQREFMTRKFLIETKDYKPEWKLTGKQENILGYNCQQAETTDNGRSVIAWFTPQIQVATGPNGNGALPGLILAMEYNNGERIIKAISIEDALVENLKKPTEGKKVTGEEFRKIVDEKRKEMQMQNGGSNVIVRVQRD